jgi:hypothetical protein
MLLRSVKQMEGVALRALDGVIGKVVDLFFDDHQWHVRYCVVETGTWLHRRTVLISPVVLSGYDSLLKAFPVDLTMDQVRHSPEVAAHLPVTRHYENELVRYYGWPVYWQGAWAVTGGAGPATSFRDDSFDDASAGERAARRDTEPFLRSISDTHGYDIAALDGTIGHVDDFLIDDHEWRLRYLVVDTRNWWFGGRKVVVAPSWIADVDWMHSTVHVDLTRDAMKESPPYDPDQPWSEHYAADLHEHYARRHESHGAAH